MSKKNFKKELIKINSGQNSLEAQIKALTKKLRANKLEKNKKINNLLNQYIGKLENHFANNDLTILDLDVDKVSSLLIENYDDLLFIDEQENDENEKNLSTDEIKKDKEVVDNE